MTLYRIVGFVCEVLICVNYARGYRLAEINSMHVNFTRTLSFYNSVPDIAYTCYNTNRLLECLPMSLYK